MSEAVPPAPDGTTPPVVFIIFNRPVLTATVFAAIRQARPSRLFVVADGARTDRPGENDQVQAARAITEQVDWPCAVERDYAASNLGAGRRVSSGITWALTRVDRVIILEDDCVPDPTFFRFCAELLVRYADDEKIAAICGINLQPTGWHCDSSYYLSRYPHSWGWATWRRAWRNHDQSMARWPQLRTTSWLEGHLEDREEARYWSRCFDLAQNKQVDAWDYQWTLSCWLHGHLVIHAARNLISNTGFGPDATHTKGAHPDAARALQPMPFPLHPPALEQRDRFADSNAFHHYYQIPPLWRRLLNRLRRMLIPKPISDAMPPLPRSGS